MKFKTALLFCLVTFSGLTFAGTNCYLGEISYFSFNYETEGYTEANGQTLDINGNQALYAVVGDRFGGDYRTKFNLPKIAPMPTSTPNETIRAYVCTDGMFPSRK